VKITVFEKCARRKFAEIDNGNFSRHDGSLSGNGSVANVWQTAILTFAPMLDQLDDFNKAFRQQAKDGEEQKIVDEHFRLPVK
jgi:hypothetical protein